jgi:hypothetical protein
VQEFLSPTTLRESFLLLRVEKAIVKVGDADSQVRVWSSPETKHRKSAGCLHFREKEKERVGENTASH